MPSSEPYQPGFEWRFLRPSYWLLWLVLGFLRLLILLPLPVTHFIGRAIGRIYYRSNDKRRDIAHTNIALCFPELSEAEQAQLVKQHFEASGENIFDYAMMWWASPRRLAKLTSFHGLERYLRQFEAEQNIILVTGHLLSVDVTAHLMSGCHPGATMMKSLQNPLLNWFITRGRRRNHNVLFERQQGLRPLIRHLRRMGVCYFIPDEDFGSQAAVFAPFFGVQSWTVTSLALLARAGNAVVVPVFTHSLPGGRGYEVYISEPLENFPSGDAIADATAMNRALEQGIRRMPEMYAWTFKLFKTRPAGEAPLY